MKDYKLKIKITKQILKDSMLCSNNTGQNCAIGKAICAIFPNSWVGRREITFYKDQYLFNKARNEITDTPLPIEAIEFISKFDSLVDDKNARLALPEFEFEITIPENVINQINLDEVREVLKNSKTLELV
jgi:hypothetical protein